MDIVKNTNTNLASPQPVAENKLHFLDYWRIVRVRKTVILTVFMLVVLTTTLVTQFLPPYYASSARIEVEKDAPDLEGLQRSTALTGYDPYWMQTQFEIIQSAVVLQRVIEKLKLNERFTERDKSPVPYTGDETMQLLKRQLDLNQYRNTTLIEIKVFSQKPEEAAEIANAIAAAYADYRKETRIGTATGAIQAMQDQLKKITAEFNQRQTNVDELRNVLMLNEIDPFSGRTLSTLDEESLRRLEALRVEKNADYVRWDNLYKELDLLKTNEFKNAVQVINPDQHLTTLMEKQVETESVKANLESDYSDDHPKMTSVKKMLATLEADIQARLTGIKQGLLTSVASRKKELDDLSKQVDSAKQTNRLALEKMRRYVDAKDALEESKNLKQALSMTISARELDSLKIPTSVVRTVDPAVPGVRPVRPHKILNITLGVIAGVILGIGLAFFIEYLDTSVKTIDDVERALQAPVLGVIPQNVGSLLSEGPESPHAEAYRVLRTNLLFSRKDEGWNTITVVSGGAGEGKSTTLFNLAVIFAQNGARVLVVDSDLRRPSLHKILGLSNSLGLTNFLLKQNTLAEVIQTTNLPTLDFLPSGKLPSSAMGILNSLAMKELIGELKRRYDFVFFDSPPIMGISDASILASEVDMTLQVIQYRRYPQPMTIRAKQMIEKVGGNLMGIVLNNINMSSDSYYYYYSGYFEESYYKSDEAKSGKSRKPSRSGRKETPETVAAADVEIKQKY